MIENPFFLWTLGGLAIPIAIHLLSRKEGKVIRLGSIRHVQETSTQQFRGIRLNEVALLILRCALIATLTLFLAGVSIPSTRESKWVVVEKGLETQPRIKTIIDSLTAEGYDPHWLVAGFPDLQDTLSEGQRINYRDLVLKLEKEVITSMIVLATNNPESFHGVRVPMGENIRWISQPTGSVDYTLLSVRIKNDSLIRRVGHSDATATTMHYSNEPDAKFPEIAQPIISVEIFADKKYDRDKKIIKAALLALNGMSPVKISIEENSTLSKTTDWRIWLSDKSAPTEKVIALRPNDEGRLFTQISSSEWRLTKRLDEHMAIESNLALQLAEIILPARNQLEQVTAAHDKRLVPDSIAWAFNTETQSENIHAGIKMISGEPFLMYLLLILLASERFLAYHRKQ